jgi:hypothetical protein
MIVHPLRWPPIWTRLKNLVSKKTSPGVTSKPDHARPAKVRKARRVFFEMP